MPNQFRFHAHPDCWKIVVILLFVIVIGYIQPVCPAFAQGDETGVSSDGEETYTTEQGEDSDGYAQEDEIYESVPNDDLAEMQKRINQVNQDPVQQAAQLLNQAQSGDASGIPGALASQLGGQDSSFSSPLYWFFMIFISVVGMGFFMSGKSSGDFGFMISGAVMSIYPYFVTNMWVFGLLGIALIVLPFYLRRF